MAGEEQHRCGQFRKRLVWSDWERVGERRERTQPVRGAALGALVMGLSVSAGLPAALAQDLPGSAESPQRVSGAEISMLIRGTLVALRAEQGKQVHVVVKPDQS